jgi:hypothetical protein
MTMQRFVRLTIIVACCICGMTLRAQDYPDSKGRDFIFTFLPNFHNEADSLPFDPLRAREHRLYIFIGADTPTVGTITTLDQQGVRRTTPFTISDPSQLHVWSDFYAPYELIGYQQGSRISYQNNQCEIQVPLYVQITSDADVTVYALNQAQFTSDAFLVLPTDALGLDHVVMAYPSSVSGPPNSNTPSQFSVTATQDNTTVTIIPSAATIRNRLDTQVVALQRGESYLVQADPRAATFGDLTGSRVTADKPIAVFGGHQRTTIPIQNSQLASRDCLVEQINPVTTWGKRSFIAPFPKSSDEENVGTDIYRVLARFDSTTVTVNGVPETMLMSGQYFEAPLLQAVDVRTSRPALMAQFKKTSSTTSSGQISNNGDPLMMLVPPSEEFLNSYTFTNVQSRRLVQTQFGSFEDDVYKEQYITVVMPAPRGGGTTQADYYNLQLDGQPITPAVQPIGTNSQWVYFTQRMTDGVHRISSDTLIGLYVFGYGQAVSYGYIGGMSFRPLDVYPPAIRDSIRCGAGRVWITDTLVGDKGLGVGGWGSRMNVADSGYRLPPGRGVYWVPVYLIDPYQDGFVEIYAIDAEEQQSQKRVDIPGFTVGALGHGSNASPQPRLWTLARKRQRCDTLVLENYGTFPRTLTQLRFASGHPVNVPTPVTLQPGERLLIETCRQFDSVTTEYDTLFVEDSCRIRPAVAYTIEVQTDKLFPRVTADVDPCSTQVRVSIRDDDPADFGLEYVRIIDSVTKNCTIALSANIPVRGDIAIDVIDPYDDAIYRIEAVDSAGNLQVVTDTIYGFTFEVNGVRGAYRARPTIEATIGDVQCVNVPVRNYGMGSITIDRDAMQENLRFSIPPGQFPIVLAPGDSALLTVCYEPMGTDTVGDADSVVFTRGCMDVQMDVQGLGTPLGLTGISRCNLPVEVTVLAAASAMPMPARDVVTIGLPVDVSTAVVRVIDVAGAQVARFDLPVGNPTKAFRLDVGSLAEGVYLAVIEANGTVLTTPLAVRR